MNFTDEILRRLSAPQNDNHKELLNLGRNEIRHGAPEEPAPSLVRRIQIEEKDQIPAFAGMTILEKCQSLKSSRICPDHGN